MVHLGKSVLNMKKHFLCSQELGLNCTARESSRGRFKYTIRNRAGYIYENYSFAELLRDQGVGLIDLLVYRASGSNNLLLCCNNSVIHLSFQLFMHA